MKHSPRIRKTVKWTSAAMVVVLVLVWAGSLKWQYLQFFDGGWWLGTTTHGACMGYWSPELFAETHWWSRSWGEVMELAWTRRELCWYFWSRHSKGWDVALPYWVPILLFSGVFVWLHRGDRQISRVEEGRCVKCGYDRAGIAGSAACPECGDVPRE